jgi:two-component system alkaline phosphatase synthesis response regulator PhoP
LFKVVAITDKTEQITELNSELTTRGLHCSVVSVSDSGEIYEQAPDIVIVVMNGLPCNSAIWRLPKEIKKHSQLPVIALLSNGALDNLESITGIDDFIIEPWAAGEVVARAKRILQLLRNENGHDVIKCGDLMIDVARCEVSVGGRLVMLTFKEYQLLKFLASNRGTVFTRDALLNKVWGYDFFGGDRTVDVHIRRLRSKIEDANHAFIETVRNIGYRFREES